MFEIHVLGYYTLHFGTFLECDCRASCTAPDTAILHSFFWEVLEAGRQCVVRQILDLVFILDEDALPEGSRDLA